MLQSQQDVDARDEARHDGAVMPPKPKAPRRPTAPRPLLVIDGNSFAHRAYHALPKTILGRGGRGQSGAILGFANMLLRLYPVGTAARGSWWDGIRSRRRPIGTKRSRPIRADANSTMR